jgi:hypothetical protein
MSEWDEHAAAHLETAVSAITASGFVDVVREEVRELWRANCERHEPEQLFDDAATLGFTAARNVLNAVRERMRVERLARTTVDAYGVPVFSVGAFDLRLFKTPGAVGRNPRMHLDFDWRGRESRFAAASRNDQYRAPSDITGVAPLFEIPRPDAADQVRLCRDVFLFWGGNLESRLTAGWAGLPTIVGGSFLAVQQLWWDETLPGSHRTPLTDTRDDGDGIGGKPVPTPIVRLRPHAGQAEA